MQKKDATTAPWREYVVIVQYCNFVFPTKKLQSIYERSTSELIQMTWKYVNILIFSKATERNVHTSKFAIVEKSAISYLYIDTT